MQPERKLPDTREMILRYSTLVSVPKNTRLSDLDTKCLFVLYKGAVCSLPKASITHAELSEEDISKLKVTHAENIFDKKG